MNISKEETQKKLNKALKRNLETQVTKIETAQQEQQEEQETVKTPK